MKNILTLVAILSFFGAAFLASCSKEGQLSEEELIEKLKSSNKTVLEEKYTLDSLDCGVHVYISKQQDSIMGEIISSHDSITLTYTAQSLQQKLTFDTKQEARVLVSDLIPGLRVAIIGRPRNTQGRLIIPSKMAYGSKRVGKLEPNSTLYFEYFKVE